MKNYALVATLVTLLVQPAVAEPPPLRRIMLYKHGVGYFERSGPVDGKEVVLDFKASEMNDVLKSLTLLDRAGGKVAGVSYESSDPIGKQLENFAFSVPREASVGQVLDQFKGARLVIRNQGAEMRGQILGVRRSSRQGVEMEIASLLVDGGELRSVPLTESTEIRLEDPRMQQDLVSYLNVVATGQRRDRRTLRIQTGTARDLSVGYVIEAPVWKTSYRLVTDSGKPGEALLQGWAIVDNPSNEDWKDVELSLVAGLPISFIQNLYQPHYMKRPLVNLPFELSLGPQVFEGKLVGGKDDVNAAREGGARQDYRLMAQSMAKRAMNQAANAPMGVAELAPGAPPREERDALAATVEAITQAFELGELFEYRVDRRIDVPRNQSAMIPFLQSTVKAERVVLFDPAAGRQAPFDGVILHNTSALTLDGGPITVLDGNRYMGEALIETLKSGESRPVSFAVDLGTTVSTAFDSRADQVVAVKVRRGVVTTQVKNVETRTYTIRNADGRGKTMILQHPVRAGWKLSMERKPEETTPRSYRFRVALPSKEAVKVAVQEEMEISNSTALNNLNSEILASYVRNKALSVEAQAKLQQIVDLKDRMAESNRRVHAKEQELNELNRDQERLRQNINNLRNIPGQEAQVNRYIAKLSEQERTIEAAQTALTADRASVRRLQGDIDRAVATLEI